ncbi:MAG: hypothetical protein JWP93_1895, partial [Polaromonas sp.]|nr:hypothetical protein [Polaromonas sp.]
WIFRVFLILLFVIGLAYLIFSLVVQTQESTSLLGVIADRAGPILNGGLGESNRGYMYDYALYLGIPLIGSGLGNSAILLSKYLQVNVIAGFLSLYLHFVAALGAVGIMLLLTFLTRPIFMKIRGVQAREAWPLYGGFFAWLVMFSVHAPEMPLIFAVNYGLLIGLAQPTLKRRLAKLLNAKPLNVTPVLQVDAMDEAKSASDLHRLS